MASIWRTVSRSGKRGRSAARAVSADEQRELPAGVHGVEHPIAEAARCRRLRRRLSSRLRAHDSRLRSVARRIEPEGPPPGVEGALRRGEVAGRRQRPIVGAAVDHDRHRLHAHRDAVRPGVEGLAPAVRDRRPRSGPPGGGCARGSPRPEVPRHDGGMGDGAPAARLHAHGLRSRPAKGDPGALDLDRASRARPGPRGPRWCSRGGCGDSRLRCGRGSTRSPRRATAPAAEPTQAIARALPAAEHDSMHRLGHPAPIAARLPDSPAVRGEPRVHRA